jgi:hypothetical protein
MLGKFAAWASVALSVLTLALATAAPAQAAPDRQAATVRTGGTDAETAHCWLQITGDGVRLRTQPNTSSTVLGLLYRGDVIDPWNGDWVNGWQSGYSPRHGRWGWVHGAYTLAFCD